VFGGESVELFHNCARPDVVDVGEGSATEWRETESEDRTNVAVAGRAEDALLETAGGFVDKQQSETTLDLFGVRLCAGSDRGVTTRVVLTRSGIRVDDGVLS
jgi:hypothetical protein